MASTIKDKVANAGQAIAEGAGKAVDFVKEKTGIGEGKDRGMAAIKEHMSVIASCGKTVGKVDCVEGDTIKLTKKDSPDGQHHYIPLGWVGLVDNHVHLTKNSRETELGWKPDSASCGCG
jgi:hypothetical protein